MGSIHSVQYRNTNLSVAKPGGTQLPGGDRVNSKGTELTGQGDTFTWVNVSARTHLSGGHNYPLQGQFEIDSGPKKINPLACLSPFACADKQVPSF